MKNKMWGGEEEWGMKQKKKNLNRGGWAAADRTLFCCPSTNRFLKEVWPPPFLLSF
jgi:hypothetical protein